MLELIGDCEGGCTLKRANRLSSGLALLHEELFDVALLDLGLPDSNGIETLLKLREREPDLPIIILTGLADEEFAEKAISQGAQDYLVKGKFNYDLLYRSIRYAVERKKAQLQLEAAYREMEAFSYSVSHDLRAPLLIIDGMSGRVLKKYYDALDDDGKGLLQAIRDEAKKMDRLINAILSLAKTGRQEIKISDHNMEHMVAEIAAQLAAVNQGRQVSIKVMPLPPTRSDETLMRQVFTNLLSNAFKFTRERDDAAIEVGGRREGNEQVYYVKDNGAGFDMAHADRLFGTFQRLHGPKEFEGIGIGLSIVRRIIERHGGRVWAEGKLGEGATFYFSLPVAEILRRSNKSGKGKDQHLVY